MGLPIPISIPPGVVRDATPAMAMGRWWDANLIRWKDGKLIPIMGWERLNATPFTGKIRKMYSWSDLNNVQHTFYGCDDKVITLAGSTFTDRTPVGFVPPAGGLNVDGFGVGPFGDHTFGTPRLQSAEFYAIPHHYTAGNFGDILMMVSSADGKLWFYDPLAVVSMTVFQQVPTSPVGNIGVVTTEERHVILLGAGGNPRRVAWCSRENPEDWDVASLTNTAGYIDLDIPGRIISGIRVKDGVLIATTDSFWILRYVGLPYVYGATKVAEHTGFFSPYALAAFSTRAMWMGEKSFWMYEAGAAMPMPCEVGEYIFDIIAGIDQVSGRYRAHISENGTFDEVWIFYPSTGQSEANRLAIYNFTERWWTISELKRTAMISSGVNTSPMAADPFGFVYYHERGWTDAGTTRLGKVWIESGAFNVEGGARLATVLQLQPDTAIAPGSIQTRFYGRETRNGGEYVGGPYTETPEGYMDVRFTARDFRMRIEGLVDTKWTVGKWLADVAVRGGR